LATCTTDLLEDLYPRQAVHARRRFVQERQPGTHPALGRAHSAANQAARGTWAICDLPAFPAAGVRFKRNQRFPPSIPVPCLGRSTPRASRNLMGYSKPAEKRPSFVAALSPNRSVMRPTPGSPMLATCSRRPNDRAPLRAIRRSSKRKTETTRRPRISIGVVRPQRGVRDKRFA